MRDRRKTATNPPRHAWLRRLKYVSQADIPWPLVAGALLIALLIGYSLGSMPGRTTGLGVARVDGNGANGTEYYLCPAGAYAISIPRGWRVTQPCEAQFGLRVESMDQLATFEVAVYTRGSMSEGDIDRLIRNATKNEGASTQLSVDIVSMDNHPFFRTSAAIDSNGTRELYESRAGFHADRMYTLTLRVLKDGGGGHATAQSREIRQAYATLHLL